MDDPNAKNPIRRSGYDRNQREVRRYGRNTERQNNGRTQKSDYKSGVFCKYCKREGHREDECRTKEREQRNPKKSQQQPKDHEEVDINNVLTQTQVTGICDQLKNGRLALHVTEGNTPSVSYPTLLSENRIDYAKHTERNVSERMNADDHIDIRIET